MVKKLLLLSLTLILSWNGFSQTVTEIKDTTCITLSTEVARQVAIDLIEGDQAKEEVKLLSEEIENYKEIVALQDSLGIMKENQIISLENIIQLQQVEVQQNLQDYERLNKELKKQFRLKTLFETTTGVAVVALLFSLIVN